MSIAHDDDISRSQAARGESRPGRNAAAAAALTAKCIRDYWTEAGT